MPLTRKMVLDTLGSTLRQLHETVSADSIPGEHMREVWGRLDDASGLDDGAFARYFLKLLWASEFIRPTLLQAGAATIAVSLAFAWVLVGALGVFGRRVNPRTRQCVWVLAFVFAVSSPWTWLTSAHAVVMLSRAFPM